MSDQVQIFASPRDALAISSRGDLERHQDFLQRHRGTPLNCGCSIREGKLLRLDVRRLQDGRLTLVRDSIEGHAEDCVLRMDDDARDPMTQRAAGILGLDGQPSAKDRNGESAATAQHAGGRYEDFNRYAFGVFSRGLSHAFVSNGSGRVARTPNPSEALLGIQQAVCEAKFTDGLNGSEAAQEHGGSLSFGLLLEDPRTVGPELAYHTPVFCWRDGALVLAMASATEGVWNSAVKRISRFGIPLSPPYFFLGVADAGGTFRRLFLHQVHAADDILVPTESSAERAVVSELQQKGSNQFFKPARMQDAVFVLQNCGWSALSVEQWRYRPDLILRDLSGDLVVVEIRGFRIGSFPFYDELLAGKGCHYQGLPGVKAFHVVDVSQGIRDLPPCQPGRWQSVRTYLGPLSSYRF